MTGREAFQIWAPDGKRWVDWVRPVAFIAIKDSHPANNIWNFSIPVIHYMQEMVAATALIIDLPGYESIRDALALAKLGFRPIPVFNGTNEQEGSRPLVDNHPMEAALLWGAKELQQIEILDNAPPAFILDSNRTHRLRIDDSDFDNSWDLYHQDLPTAEYFLEHGITSIIVRGQSVQRDLAKILYRHTKKGMTISLTRGFEEAKPVRIKKPPRDDK